MPIPAVLSPYKSVGVPEPEFILTDSFIMTLRTCIFVLLAWSCLFGSRAVEKVVLEAGCIGQHFALAVL